MKPSERRKIEKRKGRNSETERKVMRDRGARVRTVDSPLHETASRCSLYRLLQCLNAACSFNWPTVLHYARVVRSITFREAESKLGDCAIC